MPDLLQAVDAVHAPEVSPLPFSTPESCQGPDSADTLRQPMQTQPEVVDHLAIEEARGENCARIRELMAHQKAGKASA